MIAVIGHLTIDEVELPSGKSFEFMGGVACYASLGARLTGADVRVHSVIGGDFPRKYVDLLINAGVDVSGIRREEKARTTRFRLSYEGEERILRLLAHAPRIDLKDVDGDAVYLGPVAWEIAPEDVEELVEKCGKIALDPQGLLRRVGEGSVIKLRRIDLRHLRNVWILRLTFKEAEVLTGADDPFSASKALLNAGVKIVVLSMGARGALVRCREKSFIVPAYEVEAVDLTGAGDVLGGAMLAEYMRSGELEWAAAFGSAAASVVVEGYGPIPLTSRRAVDEVRRRAEELLKRIKEV